jgi:hypothetical protein
LRSHFLQLIALSVHVNARILLEPNVLEIFESFEQLQANVLDVVAGEIYQSQLRVVDETKKK